MMVAFAQAFVSGRSASTFDPIVSEAPQTCRSSNEARRERAEDTESVRHVGSKRHAKDAATAAAFSLEFGNDIRGNPPAEATARISADKEERNDGSQGTISSWLETDD